MADVGGHQTRPLPFHALIENRAAAADLSKHCARWRINIIEHDLTDRRCAEAHLRERLSLCQARRGRLQHESSDAAQIAFVRIGARINQCEIRDGAIG